MVDIYKELEEEIALAGGIDKLVQSDIAKIKLYRKHMMGYTPEQALAEASSPIRQAEADVAAQKIERARSEFDQDLKNQKERNKLHHSMTQGLMDEYSRRTKVMIMLRDESVELENDISEFLGVMEGSPAYGFKLIDIKFSAVPGSNKAMLTYSEIKKPKETI